MKLTTPASGDMAEALAELSHLSLSNGGPVSGFIGIIKFGPGDHRGYAFGDYVEKPEEFLPEMRRLERKILRLQLVRPPAESRCNQCALHHLIPLPGIEGTGPICPEQQRTGTELVIPPGCHYQH